VLRLDKLETCGFKSFGDRTEILFREGITAIVGPNGCGKSNIGDAINWVLGEQSAKMLRGQNMADVIFSGSEARKPLGMAEVSLCFTGADGIPQADQGKLTVTRRLFRNGDSEYRVNGARARLRDIQELLRHARVGARTYATIEQGKIDQVLNSKPRERRALIEDAAGIAGYKHKRRLAELKLEATQANLLRVNDIVIEVERQINSLKRQAAKARRYRRLREELRRRESLHFAARARALDLELQRLGEQEVAARDAEAEAAARLGRLDAAVVADREALDAANRRVRDSSDLLHRSEIEIDRGEGQIRACRERIAQATEQIARQETEAQLLAQRDEAAVEAARSHGASVLRFREESERVAGELAREQAALAEIETTQRALRDVIDTLRQRQFAAMARASELRNRARSGEEAALRIRGRRERIEAERAEARDDLSRIESASRELALEAAQAEREAETCRSALARDEARLCQARAQETAQVESLSGAREREQSELSRLATLEDVETRFAGLPDGVKGLLGAASASGIRTRGVVADYVQASPHVEGAAEHYLRGLLPAVIVEDDQDARRAAAFLRAQGAGRTSLICKTQPAGGLAVGTASNGRGQIPRAILDDPRVLGQLRDNLTLKAAANGVVAERIGDAILVDSLESALDLHRRHPAADYLTRHGEIVYASGVIAMGGDGVVEQGLLAHSRKIEETRAEAAAAATETALRQRQVDELRVALTQLEAATRARRETVEREDRRAADLGHRVQRLAEESERGGRRSELLAQELAALAEETSSLALEVQNLREQATQAESSQRELESELAAAIERSEREAQAVRERSASVIELRAAQATSRARLDASAAEARRLAAAADELGSRLEQVRGAAASAAALVVATRELLARTESELALHIGQREQHQAVVGRMEREIAEGQARLAGREVEQGSLRITVETLRETTRAAELARARSESTRAHLDDLCLQELGLTAAAAADSAGAGQEGEGPDLAALEAGIAELKARIEGLGPVNMTAIDEFSELEARHGFLTTQRDDLSSSMESLRESIRRINRESRQRFTEAFEQIRQSYQEVFKLLFSGGKADLRLEEGEDVLECGIEILAQPPGKRLAGVHLLSGGEKALSAIALLLAIFRYQPSPFCMLDEVDAALDESNVARFTRMIGEYAKNTQFVIITHNKLSMEVADLLYGVTMEEPGVSKVVSLELR